MPDKIKLRNRNLKERAVENIDYILDIAVYTAIPCIVFSRAFVEMCVAVICVSWFLKMLILKDISFMRNWLFWPAVLYVVMNILSSVRSVFLVSTIRELLSVVEYVMFFFAVIERFKTKEKIRKAFMVFAVTFLVIIIDGYFQFCIRMDFLRLKTLGDILGSPRVTASFSHPNSLGAFLTAGFMLNLGVLFERNKKIISITNAVLFLLLISSFYLLILTYSRGAWLGFASGILVFALFRDWRLLLVLCVLIIVSCFILPDSVADRFKSFVLLNDGSVIERIESWKYATQMIAKHPFLGSGLKSFSLQYGRGYTHNCYLQMAVETGICGVLSFLVILFHFVIKGIIRYVKIRREANSSVLLGLIACVIAFMVQSFVDNNYYSIPLAVGFWFLLGIGIRLIDERSNFDKVE
ncbi:MAG: O-antigen ligase family protein [Candidatus Theseobacter exili]|nr:O-antigen ligase family protein [Candidatus Theseobacter exili]